MKCDYYLIRSYSLQRTTLSCRPGDPYFAYINFGPFLLDNLLERTRIGLASFRTSAVVYSWFCLRPASMIAPCRLAPAPDTPPQSSASTRLNPTSPFEGDDCVIKSSVALCVGPTHCHAADTLAMTYNTRLPVEESRATSRSP
jgi:hypothetical protein